MSSREEIKKDFKELIPALGISDADSTLLERLIAQAPADKQLMVSALLRDGMKMQKWNKDKMMYYGIGGVVALLLLGGAFFMGKKMSSDDYIPFEVRTKGPFSVGTTAPKQMMFTK